MINYASNYLFVGGFSDRPAYQIMSNGKLFKFAPGNYQTPVASVAVSFNDVQAVFKQPLSRNSLVQLCDDLFIKRCKDKSFPGFVTSEEEAKLSEVFDAVRAALK